MPLSIQIVFNRKQTIAKGTIRLDSCKAILHVHVLGLLHNNQAYTMSSQFIQTSTGLTVLTLASFFLDNDVRNIRMLNNVTFNFF